MLCQPRLRCRRDIAVVGTLPIEADRSEAADADGDELLSVADPRGELAGQRIERRRRIVGGDPLTLDDLGVAGEHGDRLGPAELDPGDEQ